MSGISTADSYCAQRLKVLADPSRFGILQLLMKGPMAVSELMIELNIEQTLLSHHLKTLKDGGFVVSVRDGKSVRCRLADKVLIPGEHPSIDLGCCRLEMN